MKQPRIFKWIGGAILILLCGCLLYRFVLLPYIESPVLGSSPPDKTAEEIFVSRVLGGIPPSSERQSIPPGVTRIEAVEGWILFGYMNAPAFIRFESTDTFISELIEKDLYSPMPCELSGIDDNLIQRVHREAGYHQTPEWWKPSEVSAPLCYYSTNCIYYEDDGKYLLVDSNSNVRYFSRRAVCGLCPGGSRNSYECKPIRFQ